MNKFKKEEYIRQIYNEDSGNWTFQVRYKGHARSFSEKEYITASNAWKKAVAYRNSLLSDNAAAVVMKRKKVRDVYNESFEVLPVRNETRRKLDGFFNKYITTKDMAISELKQIDIVRDLTSMIELASDDTIYRVFSIYRKIVKYAMLNDYVAKDITLGIIPPKSHVLAKRLEQKIVSREDLIRIEDVLMHHTIDRNYAKDQVAFLEVLWFTGMRPAEAAALLKKDIDFKRKILKVYKSIGSSIDDRTIVRSPKTPLSVRDIPIHEDLLPTLKELCERKTDRLFEHNGTWFDTTNIGNNIHLQAKRYLGISFHLYQIRHTFSQRLLLAGVDPRTHQELMGHATYTTSVNYGDSNIELKRKAIRK